MTKTESLAQLFGRNVKAALQAAGKHPGPDNLRALTKVGQGGAALILKGQADVRLSTVEKVAAALRVKNPWELVSPSFVASATKLSSEEKQEVEAVTASVQGMSVAQMKALRQSLGKLLLSDPFPPDQMSPEWDATNHKDGAK